jgi:hypothetical protein
VGRVKSGLVSALCDWNLDLWLPDAGFDSRGPPMRAECVGLRQRRKMAKWDSDLLVGAAEQAAAENRGPPLTTLQSHTAFYREM